MPRTPEEHQQLLKLEAASENANVSGGEGISLKFVIRLFNIIDNLRDSDQQVRQRLRRLEQLVLKEDAAEVYLTLTPSGEERIERRTGR